MVRFIVLGLLVFSLVCGQSAYAQKAPLACLSAQTGGVKWENGRWRAYPFKAPMEKFILVLENGALTPESVSSVISPGYPAGVTCFRVYQGRDSCVTELGKYLFFDAARLEGTVASTLGGAVLNKDGDRDTVTVTPFTCVRF